MTNEQQPLQRNSLSRWFVASRLRRRVVTIAATATLAAVGVGSAIAFAQPSSRRPDRAPHSLARIATSTPRVFAVDPAIASRVKAFGRSLQPVDIPPADIINHALTGQGANPQLARLAGDFDGQDVYLVPDQGGMCLVSSELLAQGCFQADDVLAGRAGETIACYPFMAADQQEQFGILPGATDLEATYSDGSVKSVQLLNEVFVLNAVPTKQAYPVTLSWLDSAGQRQSEPTSITPNLQVPNPCPPSTESPLGGTPAQQIALAKARIERGLQ